MAGLGGQVLADVSPSGGRHVFILFAAPLPWLELRDVTRALGDIGSRRRKPNRYEGEICRDHHSASTSSCRAGGLRWRVRYTVGRDTVNSSARSTMD